MTKDRGKYHPIVVGGGVYGLFMALEASLHGLKVLILDALRHVVGIPIPLPPLFSIELGILLVSVKIIWMIHKQTKVEHFQFWILNTIEFRLNEISKKISAIEKHLK